MKNKLFFLLIILHASLCLFSQKVTVTGYVTDGVSNESLIGATVYDHSSGKGTVTNSFGYFSLTLPTLDSIILSVSYIGYKPAIKKMNAKTGLNIVFKLNAGYDLKEVKISANEDKLRRNSSISSIPIKVINEIPNIIGEPDVLKTFQLLPGIQGGSEGSSSLIVRGGSPDQNLILLDDILLYYVNHIGGFVSVFDQNAIKSISVYKGAFPARYGGRLSSVFDIRMKDGNMKEYHGGLGISLINSKVFIEGPIKKERSSILVSFRRSNIDLATRLFSNWVSQGTEIYGYTFYDLNVKLNQIINDKNRIYFNFYSGRDKFFTTAEQGQDANDGIDPEYAYNYNMDWKTLWGNNMASTRWNHIFNSILFSNLTLAYSRFAYKNEYNFIQKREIDGLLLENTSNVFSSGIEDLIFKADFDYNPFSNHKIKFGLSSIYHRFNPGTVDLSVEKQNVNPIDTVYGNNNVYSIENYVYLEDNIDFKQHFFTNIGLGLSNYIVDSKSFFSMQPRLKLGANINNYSTLIVSYSRMNQYIHLLSNSSVGIPTDLWVPATRALKPESSDQLSIGFTQKLKQSKYTLKTEVFYKTFSNLIDYKSGANFFANPGEWESQIETNGIGIAKGLEFLFKKNTGKLTGWIAYTLSNNERKFENLNSGKFYPYKYDKRHDLSLVLLYTITNKISFSANWVYCSGTPITLSNTKYRIINLDYYYDESQGLTDYIYETAYEFTEKNNVRLSAYHRLDVGFKFSKEKKRGTRIWNISVYNIYNRKNAYFLYYKTEDNVTGIYKFSLLPIIPSIGYTFNF